MLGGIATKRSAYPVYLRMEIKYDPSWTAIITPLLKQGYMQELIAFIDQQRQDTEVFPLEKDVFKAFVLTPFPAIKVLILGQDPYHNTGQAHGLSFSVPAGTPFPPSLRNIFKELASDISGFEEPSAGDLSHWAKQGVFLLNSILTVKAHQAGSHQKMGWEKFTDAIIQQMSTQLDKVVFVLWGAYAHKKEPLIDAEKHLILKAVHPSPLSAHRGFWGSKPFSKVNIYLRQNGKVPIDWNLK